MTLDFSEVNYFAIIVAVVINMVAGALWYSPLLFARLWMKEVKMTEEDIRHRRSAAYRGYAISIVGSIVIALALSILVRLAKATTAADGVLLGLLAGIGFVVTTQAASYSFEGRSLRLYLINVGFPVVTWMVLGILLAVWR